MPLFDVFTLSFFGIPTIRFEYAQANDAAEMQTKLERLIANTFYINIMDVDITGAGAGRNFMACLHFTLLDEPDNGNQPVLEVDEARVKVFRDSTEQGLFTQVNRFFLELSQDPEVETFSKLVTGGSSDSQTYMAVLLYAREDEPQQVAPEVAKARAENREKAARFKAEREPRSEAGAGPEGPEGPARSRDRFRIGTRPRALPSCRRPKRAEREDSPPRPRHRS